MVSSRRWLSAPCCCHLHSTDSPELCGAPDTVGSARVSMTAAVRELEDGEDEDEDEAAAVPAGTQEYNISEFLLYFWSQTWWVEDTSL